MSGSTTLWSSSIGDIKLPITPTSIDGMVIGATTPEAATFSGLVGAQVYNTNSGTSGIVLTAPNISGGFVEVDLGLTGAITTAINVQLPTVAALVALLQNGAVGQAWKLRVINVGGTSSGVFTITTNTGWTIGGTATVAVGGWREFLVTLTSLTAQTATLQSVGTGTNS
jgi:hypothetical protein